eukprot:992260-Amorphochlora_amoeboformis.AAC.2
MKVSEADDDRSPPIRAAVFEALGLHPDYFSTHESNKKEMVSLWGQKSVNFAPPVVVDGV